ncbi:MAG TPA: DUF4259 domain-containing protein [Lacunisphaera sp.]|nr:DUF4259 domain-containing protein [Lacunisphaera sp.]
MKTRRLAVFFLSLVIAVSAQAGAWAYASFANDDALDWVENELKPGGQRAVETTIARVAKGSGYLDLSDGCYAVAACEVLAAAQGRPAADLPDEVAALAKKLPSKPSESVRKNAREALDRVLGKDSELSALWRESKADFEKWQKLIEDLKSRV